MRMKGYRAEIRSKHNHETMARTNIKQTESAAKREGERHRKTMLFANELYVKVVKVEEHIL